MLDQSGETEIKYLIQQIANSQNLRSKADSQIAIFADNEWASRTLRDWENTGMLPMMGYDKPAWRYFPRRHISGPVVAYTDGHAKMFPDETRQKTWHHTGKYYNNQTFNYGNGWALFIHVFDEE